MLALLLATLLPAAPAQAADELVDVLREEPRFVLDLAYARADNFTGRKLYPVARCLLRRSVAAQLLLAQRWLDRQAPGTVLVLKDCYRPRSVQVAMFAAVKGTPRQSYVADPVRQGGSAHSFGAAVDVTLWADGHELDLGTPHDHLGKLAEPRHEARFLALGKLTAAQLERRHLLRNAMLEGGGFRLIRSEWWHFDAAQASELRRRWSQLDVPLDSVP
jgi:D-alanyl-D-alanine dipeptidase